jgi:ketosteroid isomerase-like protein
VPVRLAQLRFSVPVRLAPGVQFVLKEKRMTYNRLSLFALGFVATFTIGMAAAPARAAGSKSETDQEVLKVNAECNDAELRADIPAMDKCETDDFTHTHANGQVEHKAGYLKGVESGAHKFLALDLSDVHVRSYGDTAIVDEHMHLRANNGGHIADVQNLVMTVWTKQDGQWREAAWIAVPMPGGTRGPASEAK